MAKLEKKTFLEFLNTKGIESQADFSLLSNDEKVKLQKDYSNYSDDWFAEQLSDTVSNETLEATKSELIGSVDSIKDTVKEVKETLKTQGETLTIIKDSKAKADREVPSTIRESIVKSLSKIREFAKKAGKHETLHIDIKADTTTASVVNNTRTERIETVGQLATRRTTALDFFPTFPISPDNDGKISYLDWDEATKARAASMKEEGGTFDESTAAWQEYSLKLKKVADIIPMTDEFMYDDSFLVNELTSFLSRNVELIADTQIVLGDGLGNNLTGMDVSMQAYSPTSSGIANASIYDLLVKVREDIEAQGGNKYRVNGAFMNIADINKMKLTKDSDGNYVMPPFVTQDGQVIDGITVIENNAVQANTAYIGDITYARLYAEPGFRIERGYATGDFENGRESLRVYRRLLFLIRTVDQTGFRKVTSISGALTTLAS